MRFELWRERLAGAAMVAGMLLAGLRAPANAEEPDVEKVRTETIEATDDGEQTESVDEDVLLLPAGEGDEASGLRDVLRAVDVGERSPALQIEALPAENILSVRAEPATS